MLAEESVTYLSELWAGEFHSQGTPQTTFVLFFLIEYLYKALQSISEHITMLDLLQRLMLSTVMNRHLQDNQKLPRDANGSFLLWNKNYQIKTLMLLNNIFWRQ